jgi:hypothetical protein
MDPRFRPTLWPGTIVPVPPLHPFGEVTVQGDWIVWPVVASEGQPKVHIPEDFYLREMLELQPGDLEAVARLIGSYGALFSLDLDELDLSDYESYERDELLSLTGYPEDMDSLKGAHGGIHRDLVRTFIDTLQRAAKTFLACQSAGGLDELVEPNINDAYLSRIQELNAHNPEPWPRSLDHLRRVLIEEEIRHLEGALRAALSNFSVGIGDLEERYPTIYSTSFLQLYNHMAEGATARRCANETCDSVFVRQRGRAEYQQYRTHGIKYCSRGCAKAQAQRELRRRRRVPK